MDYNEKKRIWMYSLTGMLLMIATTGFARMAYGVIMPYMQLGLEMTYAQAGLLGTLISLGYLLMVLTAGMMASRFGGKTVILSGGLIVVVGLFGFAVAPSFLWAAFMSIVVGMGSAMSFVPLISLMVSTFPQQRGLVLGFLLSGAGLAMLISGFIAPIQVIIFSSYSWRLSWVIFAIFSILSVWLAAVVLKNPNQQSEVLATFEATVIDKSIVFKNKEVIKIACLYFTVGVAYLIPILFQMGFMFDANINSTTAGTIFAIAGLFSILGGPFWGFCSDRLGRKMSLLIALAISIIGTAFPVIWTQVGGFVLSAIILGLSIGGLMVLIQAAVSVQVPTHVLSIAVGFTSFFFAFGQMIGPGIAGWMIEHLGGFREAYIFSTSLYVLGLGIGLTIKMKHARSVHNISR